MLPADQRLYATVWLNEPGAKLPSPHTTPTSTLGSIRPILLADLPVSHKPRPFHSPSYCFVAVFVLASRLSYSIMTSYASEYPDLSVDPGIREYYETFYKTSDTPEAHEKYAESFTEDATLTIASKTAKGRSGTEKPPSHPSLNRANDSRLCTLSNFSPEILAMRKGMWEKVSSRQHNAIKIFPFGPNAHEVMLYGTVAYWLKNGKSSQVDWAARAHLVKQGEDFKMDYYQVYLVGVLAFSYSKRGFALIRGDRILPQWLRNRCCRIAVVDD